MVRLENKPTQDNKNHWTAFRDNRRKTLFGSNEPPADKTAVDLIAIDKELASYTRIVTTMSQKDAEIIDEVSSFVCESIGFPVSIFNDSRKNYMHPKSPYRL